MDMFCPKIRVLREEALRQTYDELEERIKERTTKLEQSEARLANFLGGAPDPLLDAVIKLIPPRPGPKDRAVALGAGRVLLDSGGQTQGKGRTFA